MERKNDLRRESRLGHQGRAFLTWDAPGGGSCQVAARAVNFSHSGIALECADSVPVRTTVGVHIPGLELRGLASVRYCTRRGLKHVIGLEMFGIPLSPRGRT
jgi:hypothetical protein